jgi:hypothetical protein
MTDPAHLISHRSVDAKQAVVRGDRCRVFTREAPRHIPGLVGLEPLDRVRL